MIAEILKMKSITEDIYQAFKIVISLYANTPVRAENNVEFYGLFTGLLFHYFSEQ